MQAAVLLVAVIASACVVDYQARHRSLQEQRNTVLSELNLIRARLEGNIVGNLQVVRGLVATIATEPLMGQDRFDALARNLVGPETQLRNVAAAPGMVVTMIYPIAGNERAMGLDYRSHPTQRGGALRARDERRLVLAGPIDLRQGGQGFVGRYPVFTRNAHGEQFWGLVSAVIDTNRLYQISGLLDADNTIDIAIRGRDGSGKDGELFFGSAAILQDDTVTADVNFASGSWQMLAVPKAGWVASGSNLWIIRAIMAAAGVALIVALWSARRLTGERQRNLRDVQRLSQRLRLALDVSAVGVWEQDVASGELKWDRRMYEIYGLPQTGRPLGHGDWLLAVHPDDRAHALENVDLASKRRCVYSSEYRIVRPDGTTRFLRTRAALSGEVGQQRLVGAEWDVTGDVLLRREIDKARHLAEMRNQELERIKSRIEHNALHDPLTGLPNRRYLDQKLTAENGRDLAILHIDLDRFKQINDTLGHAAGDAMLVRAATVLTSTAGPDDFVARVGGDEFVVVSGGGCDTAALGSLAEKIILTMSEPVPYMGNTCRFGVSIGIAISTGLDMDAGKSLINADLALYRAKRRGRNRYEFFDQALQLDILHTKMLADDILGGLERNEFTVFYQPQFDAQTHRIAGAEALVRWEHPVKGLLAPAAFMKIAEELNVVADIDRLVLRQAKADLDRWNAAGFEVDRVSVNVSARRLEDPQLIQSLHEMRIAPGAICFELVESIFLDDHDDLRTWNVDQIKALGIDIEIDDFGTGHASIVSLLNLKPKRLKIDRQLVEPILSSASQRQLVASIIEIGKSLGIEVIAEGVETHRHADVLRVMDCDILQGFALGRPMPGAQFSAFLNSHRKLQAEPLKA